MLSTKKVNDIVFVVESGESSPKTCPRCRGVYFQTRPKSKDAFSATFVDCIGCNEAFRLGGFVWPE